MSKSELHDWECEIEELSGNNADKMLDIAQDIYKTAFVRGRNSMTWEQEPCKDMVSRASVFEIMRNLMGIPYDLDRPINKDDVSDSMDEIRALSSVIPTRKKGHWIESESYPRKWYCSECGGIHHDTETDEWREVFDFRYAYCPLCGIEMENKG